MITFDDVDGIVLGELGLGLFELEYLTHRQIFSAKAAYEKRLTFEKELQYNVARLHALWLLGPHLKNPIRYPQQLHKFPWDQETTVDRLMSRQEHIEFVKKMRERNGNRRK